MQHLLFTEISDIFNKKYREWGEAEHHWKLAAQYKDIESCVELAKYYEHIERSFSQALEWTIKAEGIIEQTNTTIAGKDKFEHKIIHRRKRLIRKLKTVEK